MYYESVCLSVISLWICICVCVCVQVWRSFSAYQDPLNELFHHFWLHEQKRPVFFSASVTRQLDLRGICYTKHHLKGTLDLTECFPGHKLILDFITQCKLKRYPPIITHTCIEYLSSIAKGKPESFLIAHVEDIINISSAEQ